MAETENKPKGEACENCGGTGGDMRHLSNHSFHIDDARCVVELSHRCAKLALALKIEKEWSKNCKKELADAKKEHGCAVMGAKVVCQHLGEKLCEALKENEALKEQNAELSKELERRK